MSEKKPLYESPGEKGKRGFEDLECYQLALEVMAKIHAFAESMPPKEKYDLGAFHLSWYNSQQFSQPRRGDLILDRK
ncbi:MAG: hypothetical protein A3K45_05650 [Chloroflexi bacterium RIFOXYC12_FULL_59_14]|nr:MAG: hypothetical protein A3K45_05650 [Chloroflexi bacterium RIFOXYC12_FULL_59_14]